jgi:type II secretion system protein H
MDKRRRAFTLVELTIVILLIAIMSAAIIPAMRGTYQDALLRSSSRDLINTFGIAYSRAVSLNQLHRVRIDTQSGRYLVERQESGARQEEFVPLEDVPGCKGTLDSRITVRVHQAGENEGGGEAASAERLPASDSGGTSGAEPGEMISFNPDGTADGVTVELRDRDGFGLALKINPTTARVTLADLKRE